MFCINCDFGEIKKQEKKEQQLLPNIGICDICGTNYIMHYSSGRLLAITLFGAIQPIKNTSSSLKLYQRISFSLIERKTIVAVRLNKKIIEKILNIIWPMMFSDGILKQIETHIENKTISIVPIKLKGF